MRCYYTPRRGKNQDRFTAIAAKENGVALTGYTVSETKLLLGAISFYRSYIAVILAIFSVNSGVMASALIRHCQFPSATPGVFMRAELSSSR